MLSKINHRGSTTVAPIGGHNVKNLNKLYQGYSRFIQIAGTGPYLSIRQQGARADGTDHGQGFLQCRLWSDIKKVHSIFIRNPTVVRDTRFFFQPGHDRFHKGVEGFFFETNHLHRQSKDNSIAWEKKKIKGRRDYPMLMWWIVSQLPDWLVVVSLHWMEEIWITDLCPTESTNFL